jgi:hypothetical protein
VAKKRKAKAKAKKKLKRGSWIVRRRTASRKKHPIDPKPPRDSG